jgi:Ni,Fe-hydrogenase I cytochrome b subunit
VLLKRHFCVSLFLKNLETGAFAAKQNCFGEVADGVKGSDSVSFPIHIHSHIIMIFVISHTIMIFFSSANLRSTTKQNGVCEFSFFKENLQREALESFSVAVRPLRRYG